MLVLKRHAGESIVIGGSMEVTVAEIRGSRISLMVDRGGAVHLFELYHGEQKQVGPVTLHVKKHRSDQIRLGIVAPGLSIWRSELLEKETS